jgi:hypothetical protein
MIDAKMQKLVCDGNDDITILAEMFDYIPGFKRLMDTSESDAMDEQCRRFAGFFHYAKILEMVAAGIQRVFEKFYLGASRLSMRRMAARSMKASEVWTFNS